VDKGSSIMTIYWC